MSASSVCNTNPRQLSLPHQSATVTSPQPDLCACRLSACGNSTIPACSSVTPSPLLLFLPTHWAEAGPLLQTDQPASGWLSSPLFLSLSLLYHPLYLYLLLSPLSCLPLYFPSSSCLCLLPPCLSLSLILLCGEFAVGTPRHEWSISRSPGGSGPYNSVQWAWIVSQSTQENLSKHCHFVGCILTVSS